MIFVQSFKLLFDETQNKALDSLLAAQKKEMKPLFEQMKSEHEAMQSLVKAAPIKDAEIKAEVEKMSETMYQLTLKRAAFIQAVRKLATAEQLAKIDAQESRMKQRKDRFDAAMHKVMEEMPE